MSDDDRLERAFEDLRDGTQASRARINRVRNRVNASIRAEEEATELLKSLPAAERDAVERLRRRLHAGGPVRPPVWPRFVVGGLAVAAAAALAFFLLRGGEPGAPALVVPPIAIKTPPPPPTKIAPPPPPVAPPPNTPPPKTPKIEVPARVARVRDLRVEGGTLASKSQSDLAQTASKLADCPGFSESMAFAIDADRFGNFTALRVTKGEPSAAFIACGDGHLRGKQFDIDFSTTASADPSELKSTIRFELRRGK